MNSVAKFNYTAQCRQQRVLHTHKHTYLQRSRVSHVDSCDMHAPGTSQHHNSSNTYNESHVGTVTFHYVWTCDR